VLDISESNERQYWLWVTRPDYYLDEDGCDREDLDPALGADSDGWWTCSETAATHPAASRRGIRGVAA